MEHTLRFLGQVYAYGQIQARSGKFALFEARVRQAAAASTLLGFCDRIMGLMDARAMPEDMLPGVIEEAAAQGAEILAWIRHNHRVATALAQLARRNPEEFAAAIKLVEVPPLPATEEHLTVRVVPDIAVTLTLLSPLAHGSDDKCGNATRFRRIPVGAAATEIPYYAGNAFRGQMRDLLADHFLDALGLVPSRTRPPVTQWFFHLLYAGGGLGEVTPKRARKAAGERANSVALADRANWRDMLPTASLFGCAVGNSLMGGKFDALDYMPVCAELGYDAPRADDLLAWEYGTRRDDLEAEHEANTSMIAAFEVMRAGARLHGGVNLRPNIREVETACLHHGLGLMREHGRIGAQTRRGWGLVTVDIHAELDAAPYLEWLASHKDDVLAYLADLGALDVGD